MHAKALQIVSALLKQKLAVSRYDRCIYAHLRDSEAYPLGEIFDNLVQTSPPTHYTTDNGKDSWDEEEDSLVQHEDLAISSTRASSDRIGPATQV